MRNLLDLNLFDLLLKLFLCPFYCIIILNLWQHSDSWCCILHIWVQPLYMNEHLFSHVQIPVACVREFLWQVIVPTIVCSLKQESVTNAFLWLSFVWEPIKGRTTMRMIVRATKVIFIFSLFFNKKYLMHAGLMHQAYISFSYTDVRLTCTFTWLTGSWFFFLSWLSYWTEMDKIKMFKIWFSWKICLNARLVNQWYLNRIYMMFWSIYKHFYSIGF